jgi:hypothetical protein
MNNAETQKILEHIKTMYGKEYTPDTIKLWAGTLQDISFTEASYALVSWFQTEHWPPLPADIREKVYNLKTEPDVLASQAWDQLLRALRNAYAPESEKIWNELPDITKQIVGGYATFRAWGNTETASLETVQRPMFMKRFEELQRRIRKEAAVDEKFREPLPALSGSEHTAIEYKAEEQDREPAKPSGRSRTDDLAELRKRLLRGGN